MKENIKTNLRGHLRYSMIFKDVIEIGAYLVRGGSCESENSKS